PARFYSITSSAGASGYVHAWAGDAETAVEHFDRAIRLSPRDPLDFHLLVGKANALIGLCRDAEVFARLAPSRPAGAIVVRPAPDRETPGASPPERQRV